MNDAPSTAPSSESTKEISHAEMSPLNGRLIIPGRNCAARSFTGVIKLEATPKANPGSVILSGSSLVSASVKISPSSRNDNVQYFNVASVSLPEELQAALDERISAGMKGGMSADKYITITGASRATATRDLQDLVAKGALTRAGERRHTRYHLALEGEHK